MNTQKFKNLVSSNSVSRAFKNILFFYIDNYNIQIKDEDGNLVKEIYDEEEHWAGSTILTVKYYRKSVYFVYSDIPDLCKFFGINKPNLTGKSNAILNEYAIAFYDENDAIVCIEKEIGKFQSEFVLGGKDVKMTSSHLMFLEEEGKRVIFPYGQTIPFSEMKNFQQLGHDVAMFEEVIDGKLQKVIINPKNFQDENFVLYIGDPSSEIFVVEDSRIIKIFEKHKGHPRLITASGFEIKCTL